MGLFSFKKELPTNRYVQVKMTVGGKVQYGWMADFVYTERDTNPASKKLPFSEQTVSRIPDEIDGYPVLGLTPNCAAGLYHWYVTLPKHAVFVCLKHVQYKLLSAKFDADKEFCVPQFQSSQTWKISFYSSDAVGYAHYTVRGGSFQQTDSKGVKRNLSNLKFTYSTDPHTKDVMLNFQSDIHMLNNQKMGYGEFFPCLVREDVDSSFTLEFPKAHEQFF